MFLKVDDHQILQVECRPITCCIVVIVWDWGMFSHQTGLWSWFFTQQTHVLFNAGFMLVYLYDVELVPVLKQHLQQSGLWNLKWLDQAKKKMWFYFCPVNMTIWCIHVHRLELQKFLNFCAAVCDKQWRFIAMTVDQIDGPTAYLRHGDDVELSLRA